LKKLSKAIRMVFQSLFPWNFLQLQLVTRYRSHGLKGFDPYYFGIFCNERERGGHWTYSDVMFQSLFSWNFLQQRDAEMPVLRCLVQVSILIFLEFFATEMGKKVVVKAQVIQFRSLLFWNFCNTNTGNTVFNIIGVVFQSLLLWNFLQQSLPKVQKSILKCTVLILVSLELFATTSVSKKDRCYHSSSCFNPCYLGIFVQHKEIDF